MATVEDAAREALDLFERTVSGEQAVPSIHARICRVSDLVESGRLSTGERALAGLVLAVWTGRENFGVAELALLDRGNRRAAVRVLDLWVEATT